MAWRPSAYLMEGELDNTQPGRVTGWMRFAGMKQNVTFDLEGDFHRDIRGAKIRLTGDGHENDPAAPGYLDGLWLEQTGKVGNITAGLPPADYVSGHCYIEWYSEANGRVVIELEQGQVQVIGRPIPACESDPISREQQARNMAEFLAVISQAAGALAISPGHQLASDPSFSHWVVEQGRIVGEARSVKPADHGMSFAYVRLFNMPENAEYGYIATSQLQAKNGKARA